MKPVASNLLNILVGKRNHFSYNIVIIGLTFYYCPKRRINLIITSSFCIAFYMEKDNVQRGVC